MYQQENERERFAVEVERGEMTLPMNTEQLGKMAAAESDGFPMPDSGRMNAALWNIAYQLSRIVDEIYELRLEVGTIARQR